jgi:hypothetical protein
VTERIQILSKEETEKLFLLKYEIFQLIQILVHKRASAEPMSAANELLQTPFVGAVDRSSQFSPHHSLRETGPLVLVSHSEDRSFCDGSLLGMLVHIFRIEFLMFVLTYRKEVLFYLPLPSPLVSDHRS